LLYLLHLKNPTPKEPPKTEPIPEEAPKNTKFAEPEPIKKKGDGEAFEAEPLKPKKGGAHKDLDFDISTEQRHHMPSQASGNKGGNGGAITTKTIDHKSMASSDNQPGSKIYRAEQKALIDEGKFKEAFDMDVNDIQSKYGEKYNSEIKELEDWYKSIGKF
jgi:hypothetical protein